MKILNNEPCSINYLQRRNFSDTIVLSTGMLSYRALSYRTQTTCLTMVHKKAYNVLQIRNGKGI